MELTQEQKEKIVDEVLNMAEPELIDDSDLPTFETLEEAADEWDGSMYRSEAFVAGGKWICSEIERRLNYIEFRCHRADTYKELKSLLAYIKSYV